MRRAVSAAEALRPRAPSPRLLVALPSPPRAPAHKLTRSLSDFRCPHSPRTRIGFHHSVEGQIGRGLWTGQGGDGAGERGQGTGIET